jgi:uncharacterized protein (DUF433 family)
MIDGIEINPRVCEGKPVIRGTRIPIAVILEQLAVGETPEGILSGYPELKREDIVAALRYAKESIDHTDIEPWSA